MTANEPTSTFLVEWYQPEPAASSTHDAATRLRQASATAGDDRAPVTLTTLVAVPHDQTLFGVFTAASADDVIRTCDHAGWPADRISADVRTWLAH